jgi:hypothetical protein
MAVVLWGGAVLFMSLGLGIRLPREHPMWFIVPFAWGMGSILGLLGLLVTLNWMAAEGNARWREGEANRVYAMVTTASAIKGLSQEGLELVERLEPVTMELVASEISPLFLVRVPGGTVPFEAVEEFLQLCQRTEPYLWPEREFRNWRMAQAITRLLVMQGWAEAARGPLPGKLTRPLGWVCERFGVDELSQSR